MIATTAAQMRGIAPDRMVELTITGRGATRAALLRLDERAAQVRVATAFARGGLLDVGSSVGFFGVLDGHYYSGVGKVHARGGEDVALTFDAPLRKRACRSARRVDLDGTVMVRGYGADGKPLGWLKGDGVNVSAGGLGLRFATQPPVGRLDVVFRLEAPSPDGLCPSASAVDPRYRQPIRASATVVHRRVLADGSIRAGLAFWSLASADRLLIARFVHEMQA